jgi:N-acetylmuramoyl-L-alanine amidase
MPGNPKTVAAVLALLILGLDGCAGPPPKQVKRVAIDPGHPSETAVGASGPGGATEVQVNWAVGQKLKALLETSGYEVVLTKLVEDELVTNRHRAEIGTLHDADVMVRLHCDAGNHRGTATFYPDRQGERWGVTGPSPKVIAGSRAFAEALHPAMIRELGPEWPDLGTKGDSKTAVGARQGALTGSIFSTIQGEQDPSGKPGVSGSHD